MAERLEIADFEVLKLQLAEPLGYVEQLQYHSVNQSMKEIPQLMHANLHYENINKFQPAIVEKPMYVMFASQGAKPGEMIIAPYPFGHEIPVVAVDDAYLSLVMKVPMLPAAVPM